MALTKKVRANKVKKPSDMNLLVMLQNKASEDDLNDRELAALLGISYTYLRLLINGHRAPSEMRRSIFVAAANYLQIPVAQAFLLGGVLEPSDFLVEVSAKKKVDDVIERMRNDVEWCGFVPNNGEMDKMNEKSKILISLLYERATGASSLNSMSV